VTYLLDTNTCVRFLRHGAASPVAAHLAAEAPGDVVLCSIVVAELLFGALRSRNLAKNLADVRAFATGFRSFDFDSAAAEEYAKIRADLTAKGMMIGPNDLLIAAIALSNGLSLVTHNTAEFGRVGGLAIEDWQGP
jgi:tRNA(fMet)-specific endonuclease VapC